MNIKYVFISALLTVASIGYSYASSFIGISADGEKEEFQIGKVQSIKFDPQNSGDKGFRIIVFSSENSGVENESSTTMAILVYPNPVRDYITVFGIDDVDEILVYGLDGNIVSRTKNEKVNVRELPSGSYILSVKNQSVKFIKK